MTALWKYPDETVDELICSWKQVSGAITDLAAAT
jgi:hypothetical protein